MPAARRIMVATSAAATALAFAASADAATVATDPCVRTATSLANVMNMPVSGAGFTPGALVTVKYSSAVAPTPEYLTSLTADPAGNIATTVSPPLFNKFDTQEQSFSLTATEDANPANVATTTYKQVRIGYLTTPPTGKPTRFATHTVRGFPVGKTTYLHFRFGGVTKRNVKLGRTTGPCGIVAKRLALLPTKSRPGKWTVYIDQSPVYHKGTQPQLKYSFVITRTFT